MIAGSIDLQKYFSSFFYLQAAHPEKSWVCKSNLKVFSPKHYYFIMSNIMCRLPLALLQVTPKP
jgi:hypothetical protein